MTAHDFPSGHVADLAGMDMVLVGDSLAMVALGMQDTSEVLVEEMLLHCRSVSRAVTTAFTVSIPFCNLPSCAYSLLKYALRLATYQWDPTKSRPSKRW